MNLNVNPNPNLTLQVPDYLYSAYHFSHPPVVERLARLKPYSIQGTIINDGDDLGGKNGKQTADGVVVTNDGESTEGWVSWFSSDAGLRGTQAFGLAHGFLGFVVLYLSYVYTGKHSAQLTWQIFGPLVGLQVLTSIWHTWLALSGNKTASKSKNE